MPAITWDSTEDIAIALYEARPDTDPLTVRFTDLHKWVTELPDFKDDPAKSNEGKRIHWGQRGGSNPVAPR
jgi:FeS assembly protein IscX